MGTIYGQSPPLGKRWEALAGVFVHTTGTDSTFWAVENKNDVFANPFYFYREPAATPTNWVNIDLSKAKQIVIGHRGSYIIGGASSGFLLVKETDILS